MNSAGARPLRVGLIGAGDMSRYHLSAWAKIPEAKVLAISNRTIDRAEERARQFGIERSYADPREMLESETLDAVDIVTGRSAHVEHVLLAAEHSVDAMCQKPLAPTLSEAQQLVASVDDRIRLMVHENRRWAPHFRSVRQWIDEGLLGEPRTALMTTYRATLLPDADGIRPAVERAAYFGTEPRLLIGEVLIHQLDVLRFLLGPLRVLAARVVRTENEVAGETVAGIMLETANGAPVQLLGTFVAPGFEPPTRPGTPVGAQATDRLELTGAVGSIVMEDDRLRLRGPHPQSAAVDHVASYQACFDAAVAHFAERLRDGQPFETDAVDNLQTLQLVEDAYGLAS